ncbi:MAG TPA: autotransporter-associated beta strand repeat-containing protein, partial [Bacteroidia bacterium]|nr:autotransporter-associated beta strand repeat-containing protein [Bacteroidia bacterium]
GSSVLGSNNYNSGAERTWTQSSVDFGGKAITCNPSGTPSGSAACDYIQAQASNGVIYNTTALPGRLVSVQFTGASSVASSCYGGTSRLVNTTSGNYTVGGTQIGTAQTNTTYTWTTATTDNYTFFCIKRGTSAQYFSSIVITYETGTNYWWNGSNGTNNTTGNNWDNNSSKNWSQPTATTFTSGNGVVWPTTGSLNANFNNANATTVNIPAALTQAPANTLISTAGYSFVPSATQTFSSPVKLDQSLTVAPSSGTTFTMSGIVSSTGGLTQNGLGTTVLSAANTYTGTTTISQGTLSASSIVVSGSASNLGNASSAVVLGGASTSGTLSYTGSAATYTRGFTVNAGGGGITNTTANLLTIGTGGIANGGTLTLSNTGSGGTTISSVISSTGGIVVNNSGSGITILSGSNSYAGTTNINGGTLQLGANSTLPSGTAVTLANTSGVVLDVNAKTQTIASLAGGGGTGGNVTLGAGTLTVNGSTSTTYSGVISGTGGALVKNGTSTLTLAGANSYTGATTISAGTLKLGTAGSGANSPLGTTGAGTTVSATGAALDLNGYTLATAEGLTLNGTGISSGGALVNSSGTAVSYSGNIGLGSASSIGTTGDITLSGVVSGGFALTKVGAGKLILSGANTYSGGTTITAGTVQLNPSATLSSGACTFNGTGATLSTSGITAGRAVTFSSLTVSENATINLDNTNGHTLTFTTGSIAGGKMLTITGWQGTYGVSNTGSTAKIYVGSTATSLDCNNLGRIQFFDGTTNYAAALKSDGELVPVKTPTVNSSGISPSSATAGDAGFTITVDGTNFINGISTVTWGGSARTTTFVSATQLTASILTADLVTATTVQVGVTNGCVTSPTTETFTINAPSNSITTTTGPFGPFCNGVSNNVTLTFSKTGTFTGQYNIQISDASGNFPSDATSQLLTYVSNTATTVTATIPSGFTTGTGYKIRVVNNTPTYFSSGDNGSNIAINTTPTTPSCSTPSAACQGNAVTITGAGSTGATTYTYWTAAAPGGTQITTGGGYTVSGGNLTTPSSLAGGTYDFYVQGENAALCSSLSRQKVTVTINSLPADPTGSITVSSNPSCGPATLNYSTGYYWETSTSDFTTSGRATATDYTLNSTGTMYVRAYDGTCWSANTINTGTVTINSAISIGTSPTDQSVTTGATAAFSVSGVTGTINGYQWQVSTDGGSTWNNVSTGTGGTSASYTTAATVIGMNGYKYQCIVYGTSPCADVTSNVATLTVTVAPSGLGNYPFTGTTCTNYAPTGVATNLTLSNISPTGITCNTNVASNIFGGSSSWGTAFSSGKYLEFTATPDANFLLTATSVVFDAWRSSAGAQNYTLRSSL